MTTTIGFIGLGVMGGPMAANLVRAGFDVVGYNRSPAKVEPLVDAGGRRAGSAVEAAAGADVVITMLPDSPDVEAVLLGQASGEDARGDDAAGGGDDGDSAGVLAHLSPGATVIDMSTIRPDVARRLAEAGAQRGNRVLDAPVSGGERGAIDGVLSIMVGGDEHAFTSVKPILHAMGTTVVHVGPAGSGQTVKAANQLMVAGILEVVSEALVFLDAHGVDRERAVEVLSGGLAGNAILERKGAAMLEGNFAPGFRVDLHHKDLGIVTAAARETGVAIPVGALAATLVASLRAQGHGDLDHSALLLQVEQLSGRRANDV
ncbi:NAD(P)-dependent oxidoreductase [Actinobacteria bacterium YIM 96077]|uniref:2-hydroxy-3-oxopropionate reductase n=1 Tax=Phytoactinopolyspora halophila TaxID=1981511 RepID=A0A329QER5_9ACTN|nr:NAD(P)-dependent oxidoreductase [Phytoactinopolyspora halophila]AYY14066.1 NAD(P)-dependent oxidoreductase [Actinobacteria bacterium YIM 96077]RAW10973.1 2-hydroxy-3-oxopropionate reductase [Phytoactinopolyspora halophila]